MPRTATTCPTCPDPLRAHGTFADGHTGCGIDGCDCTWTGSSTLRLVHPTHTVTETEFTIHDDTFTAAHRQLWEDLKAWCEFHDIDPHRIPMLGTITRDVPGRRVRYLGIVTDTDGRKALGPDGNVQLRPMVAQGETAPLPFPCEETTP